MIFLFEIQSAWAEQNRPSNVYIAQNSILTVTYLCIKYIYHMHIICLYLSIHEKLDIL
jgi:hypothetical protein